MEKENQSSSKPGKTILFIDDEPSILSTLTRSLRRFFQEHDLGVTTATTAHQALEAIRDHADDIAVIVSDQRMPVLTGSDLARLVKDRHPDIPIIMLSGHADMGDVADILKAGIITFIEKPWNQEVLENELSRALEVHRLRRAERLHQERMEEDFRLCREFQKTIFSSPLPQSPRLRFRVTSRPSTRFNFGGDYYDVIELSESRFLVLMGDIAGHSPHTSYLSATLKSIIYPEYIRNLKSSSLSPAALLHWLNQKLCRFLKDFPDVFAGFSATVIDLDEETLVTADAGQPPLILVSPSGILSLIEGHGLALGVDENYTYHETKAELGDTSLMVFCSDGLYPLETPGGPPVRELFLETMTENILRLEDHPYLLEKISGQKKDTPREDDLTLLTVKLDRRD